MNKILNYLIAHYHPNKNLIYIIIIGFISLIVTFKNLFEYKNSQSSAKDKFYTSSGEELRKAVLSSKDQFNLHIKSFDLNYKNQLKHNADNIKYSSLDMSAIKAKKLNSQISCKKNQLLFNGKCLDGEILLFTNTNKISKTSINNFCRSNYIKKIKYDCQTKNFQQANKTNTKNNTKNSNNNSKTKKDHCQNIKNQSGLYLAISAETLDNSLKLQLKPIYELRSNSGHQYLTSSLPDRNRLISQNFKDLGIAFYLTKGKELGDNRLYRLKRIKSDNINPNKLNKNKDNTNKSQEIKTSTADNGPWCYSNSLVSGWLVDANLGSINSKDS